MKQTPKDAAMSSKQRKITRVTFYRMVALLVAPSLIWAEAHVCASPSPGKYGNPHDGLDAFRSAAISQRLVNVNADTLLSPKQAKIEEIQEALGRCPIGR